MSYREDYVSPVLEEYFVQQRPNLMTDMSAELPDGAGEGDGDTFGGVTYK